MASLTATATCHVCGVLAEGDPKTVDKASERHTKKTGHGTAVTAVPA